MDIVRFTETGGQAATRECCVERVSRMNRNIEIKAKVDDVEAIAQRAQELGGTGPTVLEQVDTFFVCPRGRLKLRQFADSKEGELIYYERADETGPKQSRYDLHRTPDSESLCAALSAALGVRGVVRKTRALYLIGPTRVHLDRVEGLGQFVELEVVLEPEQDTAHGVDIARNLMEKLGIPRAGLVQRAYIDLLESPST